MINLRDVTLLSIDCVNPNRALDALIWSSRHVMFAETVLLTDTIKHPDILKRQINFGAGPRTLRIVHHEESDAKVQWRPDHYAVCPDYEMAVLYEPVNHFRTSHVLYHESDAAVGNPWAWDDSWLKWDFVGAPWSEFWEPGWPKCDGHSNNVGNGGFSLRSLKFCKLTRKAVFEFSGDRGMICNDMWACITKRPWMEKQGIRYAPEAVAERFSCENRMYSGQFGFHGKWTAELNRWGGRFADIRPPHALK